MSKKMISIRKLEIIYPKKEIPKQPDIRPIGNGLYKVFTPVTYHVVLCFGSTKERQFGRTMLLQVSFEAGYICDGQSSPPISWTLGRMLPDGLVRKAALIHDALYHTKGNRINRKKVMLSLEGEEFVLSRKCCDQIYKAVYEDSAPGETRKARVGYRVLRLFGWRYWGRNNPPNFK